MSDDLRIIPTDDPRTITLPPEAVAALREQEANFREKFGRDPGPDDPLFFNPDADEPELMTAEQVADVTALMEEHGFEEVRAEQEARLEAAGMIEHHRPEKRVGRNDPCPCGSGVKFKKCHAA